MAGGFVQQACSARGEQDDRPPVGQLVDQRRAVLQVEAVGHVAAQLAHQQRAVQLAGQRGGVLERGADEEAMAAVHGRDGGRRRPDHVDRHDCLARVAARGVWEGVDGDACTHATGDNRWFPKESECSPRR